MSIFALILGVVIGIVFTSITFVVGDWLDRHVPDLED